MTNSLSQILLAIWNQVLAQSNIFWAVIFLAGSALVYKLTGLLFDHWKSKLDAIAPKSYEEILKTQERNIENLRQEIEELRIEHETAERDCHDAKSSKDREIYELRLLNIELREYTAIMSSRLSEYVVALVKLRGRRKVGVGALDGLFQTADNGERRRTVDQDSDALDDLIKSAQSLQDQILDRKRD